MVLVDIVIKKTLQEQGPLKKVFEQEPSLVVAFHILHALLLCLAPHKVQSACFSMEKLCKKLGRIRFIQDFQSLEKPKGILNLQRF